MQEDDGGKPRSTWLVAGVAAASAIVAYRIFAFLNDTAFSLVFSRIDSEFFLGFARFQETIRILGGAATALLLAVLVLRTVCRRSIVVHRIVLASLVALAAIPITVGPWEHHLAGAVVLQSDDQDMQKEPTNTWQGALTNTHHGRKSGPNLQVTNNAATIR